ncbi:MAG: aminotransferase class I/II-fold pyridoxal phosphate-dependent enzyme [Clostridia bacterium]|nr:aminotransferase class I/II-fold pyridoxal phosphate-dependent enzyme [Clostridia bacterium]
MKEKGINSFIKNNSSYPFHMPGHKRNALFEKLMALGAHSDITEIKGADDLHNPTGIIRDLEEAIANRYGSDKSYVLANGSTCGNLAAMGALGKRGDKVLVARNCHRSVYHALELFGYSPVFLNPEFIGELGVYGAVEPNTVKDALLSNEDIAFCVLTSPTYEGILSDTEAIAKLCHEAGVLLLVDQAHGAHLELSPYFTGSAVNWADLTVQSLHKTLPALTPAAVLHTKGNRVNRILLEHYLRVFQSSSPSYPLMASAELCLELCENAELFKEWSDRIDRFEKSIGALKSIKLFRCVGMDKSKLVLTGKKGTELCDFLRQRRIELEYATESFALAMTGAGDSDEGFAALLTALEEADESLEDFGKKYSPAAFCVGDTTVTAEDAFKGEREYLPLDRCRGRIAAEYLWAYPPGIPLIIPGQTISEGLEGTNAENLLTDSGKLPLFAVVK